MSAEKVGFEPTVQVTPYNTLAGCRLKPLGHFSFLAVKPVVLLQLGYMLQYIINIFIFKVFKKFFYKL